MGQWYGEFSVNMGAKLAHYEEMVLWIKCFSINIIMHAKLKI